MNELQATDFAQFLQELHGRSPFPWQSRLADRVCKQGWPKVIDLPTASGKTACIDIALFALALRGNDAPRRIFFVVDRRVIVSEAYERAKQIKKALSNAERGILKRVADELRRLSGNKEPLSTYELRGGAFRDENWVRTPLQPTIIASTVDQVGSRLLFRGYGVAEHTWPLHAGLIANDSVLFLDEAHCSKAFASTLEAVEQYRGETWARDPLKRPFHFVEMTATPTRNVDAKGHFTIDDTDRENEALGQRIFASKLTRLPAPVKCRKDELSKFAAALIEEATTLADEVDAKRVAIMVNRISTAKEVHSRLCEAQQECMLVIGRMRPLDSDWLATQWSGLKSGIKREPTDERKFVVATQCLEVGADLDFDVLVTECASIDALQQRFGRLDRIGEFKNARGAILAGSWQLTGKDGDPVYGDALRKTWDFLESVAADGAVQMGIETRGAIKSVTAQLTGAPIEHRQEMMLHSKNAPKLLPAHLDALVQTSPQPEPQPFIEYFLHGPEGGAPDVYVVWRSDINGISADRWSEIVALCPPSSAEAMPVPLWAFRKWLQGGSFKDESDVEISASVNTEDQGADLQPVLIWRGPENSAVAWHPKEISPGATVVLPSLTKSWNILGYKPETCRVDRGDEARLLLRRRICLRLHPELLAQWEECGAREELTKLVREPEAEPDAIWEVLANYPETRHPAGFSENVAAWKSLDKNSLSRYPAGAGWTIEGYWGTKEFRRANSILLEDHLRDVEEAVDGVAGDLATPALKQALQTAAHYHDYGKADIRYQAWLRNGDTMAARYAPKPIAKSGRTILRKQSDCGLPADFRHELLSVLFADKGVDLNLQTRDLVLHLVASHHGRCRPFAPIAVDDQAECIHFAGASICKSELTERPPFGLGTGAANRFWKLTRQYGWWGLAYLESMLRLADWNASDEKGTEVSE